MKVIQLHIEAKHRQIVGYLASLKDFTTVEGDESISPRLIVEDPRVSLYCLDDETGRAIFVELPDHIDLHRAPFVYQTQYEETLRLYAVPFLMFNALADELPQVRRPIFIYSTGRSGSTLLSNVFNESGVVASFSEPDVASQFADLRAGDMADDDLRQLARSTMRFLFKSDHSAVTKAHAVKFRNEGGLLAMDLLQDTHPNGKNLFLYRDAIGSVTSFYRLFKKFGIPDEAPVATWHMGWQAGLINQIDPGYLNQFLEEGHESISLAEQLGFWWIGLMDWYLEQVERGCKALAVRFDDLVAYPEATVREIFTYCDLPGERLEPALRAFARDAQAGTAVARENPREGNKRQLTAEQVQSVEAMLARHPVLKHSNFIAPGTLQM